MSQREQETIYCARAYQSLSETLAATQRGPTHPRNSLKSIRKETRQSKLLNSHTLRSTRRHCVISLSKWTIQLGETLAILVQSQQAETGMKSNFRPVPQVLLAGLLLHLHNGPLHSNLIKVTCLEFLADVLHWILSMLFFPKIMNIGRSPNSHYCTLLSPHKTVIS